MEKRDTNFGQKYVIGIYILDQKEKRKLFRKMSVRPSARPQNLFALKLENG